MSSRKRHCFDVGSIAHNIQYIPQPIKIINNQIITL